MGTYKLEVNWGEYDRLKSLGWLDRDIAKAFGISASTMCIRLKERYKYGNNKSNGNTM